MPEEKKRKRPGPKPKPREKQPDSRHAPDIDWERSDTGQFAPIGDEPLDKQVIGVRLPQSYSDRVKALPGKSEWLRRIICEAVDRGELPELEDESECAA
ncbi:MAG: hypothetical protein ACOVOV_01595 [Dolichospermum sp.]